MEVCRRLKGNSTTADIPIIMLTAKGDEVDKILGLELGADDYITKPFSVRELIARIKALLRRAAPQNEEEGILHVGGLTIDVSNYEAFRNGEKLSLTLKEFELLKPVSYTHLGKPGGISGKAAQRPETGRENAQRTGAGRQSDSAGAAAERRSDRKRSAAQTN